MKKFNKQMSKKTSFLPLTFLHKLSKFFLLSLTTAWKLKLETDALKFSMAGLYGSTVGFPGWKRLV